MASVRPRVSLLLPQARHLVVSHYRPHADPYPYPCPYQRRGDPISTHARFLTTQQSVPNIVLDRYRARLEAKAQQEGHADIARLRAAYADRIRQVRSREATAASAGPQLPLPQRREGGKEAAKGEEEAGKEEQNKARSRPRPVPVPVQTLDQILDLDKARALAVAELTAEWRLRHAGRAGALCAVIARHTWATMEARARAHPRFVLPVPRPQHGGAEMHFLQWVFDPATRSTSVLFTQLAEYKARGEFAQPHTTLTHHLDLVADKGVVLMQGTFLPHRGVADVEAQWLATSLQNFYGGLDGRDDDASPGAKERAEKRARLLEWFGAGDARFSVDELMDVAGRIG